MLDGRKQPKETKIGIYARESRDDNEKNYETIETQRDLLLGYAARNIEGRVVAVYMDDNVSGSSFDREGLNQLKEDVLNHRLDILLIKDLSRLGRSNSKTLYFLDFLEENGVRVITCDNRYDSMQNDDLVGIETWFNERYVRDISRKIRASLRFKIEKGEFVGRAPYGYRKAKDSKNKLEPDPALAENVRQIFRLYRQGYGYASIAAMLNERSVPPPAGTDWSGTAVRRILCSRVYTGSAVQGVSEKLSFKSRKTRRLPEDKWVVTEGTHEALISLEDFYEIQRLREGKKNFAGPLKQQIHVLRGVIYCGRCGSAMYARRRRGGTAYVCGNFYKNGSTACSSHLVHEGEVIGELEKELQRLAGLKGLKEIAAQAAEKDMKYGSRQDKVKQLQKLLLQKQRQKEIIYNDRLEDRIDVQLFEKASKNLNDRIAEVEAELQSLIHYGSERDAGEELSALISCILEQGCEKYINNEIVRCMVNKIYVYDSRDYTGGTVHNSSNAVCKPDDQIDGNTANGALLIEFRYGSNFIS